MKSFFFEGTRARLASDRLSQPKAGLWSRLRRGLGRRGVLALEFALVAPFFFLLLFAVFEISYDLFMQSVLDNTLQYAARQVQIGNAQGSTGPTFVAQYVCPYDGGLLNCNNLFVRVEQVNFGTAACTDFYDATTGQLPIVNGQLNLGYYYSGAGALGQGSAVGNTNCDIGTSASGFVNAGPSECIIMSAIYVAPSFLNGLILNRIKYNGKYVRAQLATAAFITEPFTATAGSPTC
jgi:hypothetical protein